jgi:uncharacterized protein
MEVDMTRIVAAVILASAAAFGWSGAAAQDAAQSEQPLQNIIGTELPPETRELALQLVQLSGSARMFDEVLPMVADQTKNAFIRANPDMQLGIISVVDQIAVSLVSRRPELDNYLARVWASGFSNDEMADLIAFYESDTGKKFSATLPQLLAVQAAAAQEWGKSVSAEMQEKVTAELRAAMTAEQKALQGDIAGPEEAPAPPQ